MQKTASEVRPKSFSSLQFVIQFVPKTQIEILKFGKLVRDKRLCGESERKTLKRVPALVVQSKLEHKAAGKVHGDILVGVYLHRGEFFVGEFLYNGIHQRRERPKIGWGQKLPWERGTGSGANIHGVYRLGKNGGLAVHHAVFIHKITGAGAPQRPRLALHQANPNGSKASRVYAGRCKRRVCRQKVCAYACLWIQKDIALRQDIPIVAREPLAYKRFYSARRQCRGTAYGHVSYPQCWPVRQSN